MRLEMDLCCGWADEVFQPCVLDVVFEMSRTVVVDLPKRQNLICVRNCIY